MMASESTQYPLYSELKGKKAVVTGAGKGIGADCVSGLIAQGCHVVALSRTQSDLDKLVEKFGTTHLQVKAIDISQWNEVEKVMESIGPFDYLINNAGVAQQAPFLEASEEMFDTIMNTNLKATMHLAQCAAKQMVANNIKGVVVNISSIASKTAIRDSGFYCCSKAAIDMLTKVIALELGPKGIRSISINPGAIETNMTKEVLSNPIVYQSVLEKHTIGRLVRPSDVTKTVLFCLSEGAGMVTGSTVAVDGGYLTAT